MAQPLAFFDERATAHPLAALLEPLRLTADPARVRRRIFVYALDWPRESPMLACYHRVRSEPTGRSTNSTASTT